MKSFGRKKLSGKPYILLTDLKYYAEEFQAFRIISREFNIFGIVFSSAQSVLYRIRYNTDQGTQYTSKAFVEYCESVHVTQSMSKAGCPYDNLKNECTNLYEFRTEEALYQTVEEFAYVTYNHVRPHSFNGYQTPYQARIA